LFRGQRALLDSHCGVEPGALALARALARALDAPLVASTTTRLLVDLNRSLGHRQLFSATTRRLPAPVRDRIVARWYLPHREAVEDHVRRAAVRGDRVIHIAAHSFAPVLDGRARRADVGLLYDPRRGEETALCARWKASLATRAPQLCVRRNYPYAGKDDGLTRHLRSRFSQHTYVGIELEINQAIVLAGGRAWRELRHSLVAALRHACA
jgi:predicted N-formylglutamate amidohydrolase